MLCYGIAYGDGVMALSQGVMSSIAICIQPDFWFAILSCKRIIALSYHFGYLQLELFRVAEVAVKWTLYQNRAAV